MKRFVSSRNKNEIYNGKEAIIEGLARNGGLLTPLNIAENKIDLKDLLNLSYQEITFKILSLFFDDFSEEELKKCINSAYDKKFSTGEISPTTQIGKDFLLELYHGPTSAFKDVALTILPHLLSTAYKTLKTEEKRKIYILTATSGDTGKAALEGFKNVDNTFITVFYPKEGVSSIQKKQMNTTTGENVEVISINGNFDDCQTLVKKCYEEIKTDDVKLSSANSINIGRLVPQIVYYFKSYVDLVKNNHIKLNDKVNFVVPTGNFGNILAGYIAKLLGCPINKLICASNENDVLTEFIRTGTYNKNRKFYNTISPSMDILISSNLERLLFILSDYDDKKIKKYMEDLSAKGEYTIDKDLLAKIQETFVAFSCDKENCEQTIKKAFEEDNRLIDTHTAVAYYASKEFSKNSKSLDDNKNIILATASPYKFCNSVLNSLTKKIYENEFEAMRELEKISGEKIPTNLKNIENLDEIHKKNINIDDGVKTVLERIVKLK